MKIVTYKCDKCGKELTEWGVVRMSVMWECKMRGVEGYEFPREEMMDLCKECVYKIRGEMRE